MGESDQMESMREGGTLIGFEKIFESALVLMENMSAHTGAPPPPIIWSEVSREIRSMFFGSLYTGTSPIPDVSTR